MSSTGTYQAIMLGPCKRPSNGTVIAEGPTMESVQHLWSPGVVCIAFKATHTPPRRLAPASLAAVRLKRLRRQLAAKAPLLAAIIEETELAQRPDFYAGARATSKQEP